jgi:tRNA(Ile)-lysidine synthase
MQGTRKLKNVLIDDHIPKDDRDKLPLLCDQEGIVWLIKHRRSDRAKICESTRRILKVKAYKNQIPNYKSQISNNFEIQKLKSQTKNKTEDR